MSGFTALNVEPDTDSEEEVDNTREIQIEEALKLYQNALKLHSQGPKYYNEAAETYEALFKSEIFNYPDSIAWYKREQLPGVVGAEAAIDEDSDDDFITEDADDNVLLQTVYLAYKNRGQFIVDQLKSLLPTLENRGERDAAIAEHVSEAIRYFGEALDRDDTDLNLWRKAAKLANIVKASRIARFCLESIIDDEDEVEDEVGERLNLERASAVQELQQTLSSCEDDVSLAMNQFKQPRKILRRLIEQKADPFPHLKQSTPVKLADLAVNRPISHTLLIPEQSTWTALGETILTALRENSKNVGNTISGSVRIQLPDLADTSMADSFYSVPDSQGQNSSSNQNAALEESKKGDTDLKTAPNDNVLQSTEATPTTSKDSAAETDTAEQTQTNTENDTIAKTVQTRKRSTTFDEQTELGRTKSKRIRARESQIDPANGDGLHLSHAKYMEDLLEPYISADEAMFTAADAILSKLGWSTLGSAREARTYWSNYMQSEHQNEKPPDENVDAALAVCLRSVLDSWDDAKTRLSREGLEFCQSYASDWEFGWSADDEDEMKRVALSILSGSLPQGSQQDINIEASDNKGLLEFTNNINNGELDIVTVALKWLEVHLSSQTSSYLTERWSPEMKQVVTDMITEFDGDIFARLHKFVIELDNSLSKNKDASTLLEMLNSSVMLTQALFELHLEALSASTKSDSIVAHRRLTIEQNRVSRWGSLAYLLIKHQINFDARDNIDSLKIRHLWASILRLNMSQDVESDYILESLRELKEMLASLGYPTISLANNSIICEISIDAIEQEVSRLRSLDFFKSLLAPGYDDAVESIEHIAPLLEPESVEFVGGEEGSQIAARFKEIATFLDTRSPSLRLYLWDRLQNAYSELGCCKYTPKVIDCCVHKIEVILDGLYRSRPLDQSSANQSEFLLKSLNSLCSLLRELRMKIVENSDKAFDCLDMPRLQAASEVFTKLLKLLYTLVVAEDAYKLGIIHPPDIRPASNAKNLEAFKDKLRSILNDCWTLQYLFLKEAMTQDQQLFESQETLRSNYLRACHGFLGIRFLCKYADKAFLQLMAEELQTLPKEDDYEYEMAQLYFDLYGLKFGAGLDAIVDHHCTIGPMELHTAISVANFIMMQAKRINIKDLPKSELKAAIDTVQMSIGPPAKGFPSVNLNRRLLKNFLQAPVDRRQLYRCLDGIGDISISTVDIFSTQLAKNGWFTLLGQSALVRFRSQKRLTSTSTEDLDTAIHSFKQEIEHGYSDWKTWYYLAQAYDLKLEEDLSWAADKINKNDEQLVEFQRAAIHAYTLAVAYVTRTLDLSPQDTKLTSELYADFGKRLYASSREPLSMKAFSLANLERPFSSSSYTMYMSSPVVEVRDYSAWELASYMFQKAMDTSPGKWKIHYMYSKCLWKMFCYNGIEPEHRKHLDVNTVLDAFADTIRSLPRKRDSRSEPILEPHYKLASVVHKLVTRGHLTVGEAYERLQASSYAQKVSPPDGMQHWRQYILDIFKRMRSADKANWHHRMPLRAAHIIYDSSKDITAASEARAELTQQIFTKNMTLQVWRPENERAGRHFVYTTRYVRFFVHLLDQLNDRVNIEQIAKRVRKRASDFADHTGLWKYICESYIQIIRRCENIPSDADNAVFKTVTIDDFQSTALEVEKYYLNHSDSPLIGVLRDATELKKLNSGLLKTPIIEDLVVDTYGVMYETVVRKNLEEAAQQENRERMRVDHLLENTKPSETTSDQTSERPEDATMPGSKTKAAKLVTRKDIVRRAEALFTLASRPPVPIHDEHTLVPMLAVSIPIRPRPRLTEFGNGNDTPVEQDSTVDSMNATDDEDSELSELERSPEPPKSVSSLQETLQERLQETLQPPPEQSTNSTSGSFAEKEDESMAPASEATATAQIQDSTMSENTVSSDIEMD